MKRTLFALVGLFMVVALPVSAATFKTGDTYEYRGGEAGDMYIAAGSVDVSGDIVGDGVLAGGDVSVLGNISQDLMVAGGSIKLLGSVGDDARVAGGNVTISGNVASDLIALGGVVKVLSGATVSGDTVIAGGSVVINGAVLGDLTVYGEDVVINGPVTGNVTLKFTKKVALGENASIAGNFTYTADSELVLPEGVTVGGSVTRLESPVQKMRFDKGDFAKVIGALALLKVLLMLIASVLAVVVFKQFSKTVAVHAHNDFWKNTLIGFITIIVVPVAVVLLFVSILGACVGGILLIAFALMLMVSKVYAGVVSGLLISKWIKKEMIVDWKWTVLGVVALELVTLVPFFGGLAMFAIVLATLGTLGTLAHKKFWLAR